MKEMNYYMLYLEKVLLDNDLAKRYGKAVVEARSEQASESYEQMRRSGFTVEQAHEFAASNLLQGIRLPEAKFRVNIEKKCNPANILQIILKPSLAIFYKVLIIWRLRDTYRTNMISLEIV